MIRLYNRTRHPDGPIRDALAHAARAIGVRGDVVVKVTPSRRQFPGAYVRREFPCLGFLRGVRGREGRDGRLVGDRPGFAVLSLPARSKDWLEACWWFMRTAIHEMAHVRQIREGRYGELRLREALRTGSHSRRMRHDSRPCEVDAWDQVDDAGRDKRRYLRQQDATIDMALAIEEVEGARGGYGAVR